MTKFEEKGVELQFSCNSEHQADKMFSYSCDLCVKHGCRIVCSNCAIAKANVATKEAIASAKQAEKERRLLAIAIKYKAMPYNND